MASQMKREATRAMPKAPPAKPAKNPKATPKAKAAGKTTAQMKHHRHPLTGQFTQHRPIPGKQRADTPHRPGTVKKLAVAAGVGDARKIAMKIMLDGQKPGTMMAAQPQQSGPMLPTGGMLPR